MRVRTLQRIGRILPILQRAHHFDNCTYPPLNKCAYPIVGRDSIRELKNELVATSASLTVTLSKLYDITPNAVFLDTADMQTYQALQRAGVAKECMLAPNVHSEITTITTFEGINSPNTTFEKALSQTNLENIGIIYYDGCGSYAGSKTTDIFLGNSLGRALDRTITHEEIPITLAFSACLRGPKLPEGYAAEDLIVYQMQSLVNSYGFVIDQATNNVQLVYRRPKGAPMLFVLWNLLYRGDLALVQCLPYMRWSDGPKKGKVIGFRD